MSAQHPPTTAASGLEYAPLSPRLRPGIECAPWVIEAVKKLEALAAQPAPVVGGDAPHGYLVHRLGRLLGERYLTPSAYKQYLAGQYDGSVYHPEDTFTPLFTRPAESVAPGGEGVELDCYDAGLLNDFGGGNVEWWQDYIRAELARAHDFYQSQLTTPPIAQQGDSLPRQGEGANLDRLVRVGDLPAPITNPEAWPTGYADGFNDYARHVDQTRTTPPAAQAAAKQASASQGEVHVPGVGDFPAGYAAEHMPEDDPPPSRWVTQTKFYDPSQPPEVCTGNCTEAALASILGIGLDDVDSFQGLRSEHYWEAVETFINSKGYDFDMLRADARPDGLYLADGPSERGCGHFVVMRDGKMVHDPHPSRAGLKEIERVWTITPTAQPAPVVGGWVDTMVEILRTSLDADIDAGESLHTLVIRASNALYWRGKEIEELRELLATRPAESVAQGGAIENIAEDAYWAIAEHLGTPSGWSVQEHVWEIRELLQESMFAFGSMGANADTKHPQRNLWERINASLQGIIHE